MATPDYSAWNQVNEFESLQAAFLWLDLEPETRYHHKAPQKVQAIADELHYLGTERAGDRHPYFSRAVLIGIAVEKKVKPPFLFPELQDPATDPSKQLAAVRAERDELRAAIERLSAAKAEPATRENTYPNIIGALLSLFLDTDDNGKPLSSFTSQSGLIDALVDRHSHRPGISESNLKKVFALANKSLSES